MTFSFLTGQQGFTEAVFYCIQSNVNFVTYLDFQLALGVFELLSRDGGLRFQTSVNQYYVLSIATTTPRTIEPGRVSISFKDSSKS